MPMSDKEIIEAALFAAGGPVAVDTLSEILSKQSKHVRRIMNVLMEEYAEKAGGIEIIEADGKYVMQVKAEFADSVRSLAPKELSSPVLRTLSIIAYHQPIIQSDLVEMRGSCTYDHMRVLREEGLVDTKPHDRSKMITTSRRFAEYFGLASSDPVLIKEMIAGIAKQSNLGKWVVGTQIGTTPMLTSLLETLNIEHQVVHPYDESEVDALAELDTLIVTGGYAERISKYFDGKIIEINASTFSELMESVQSLASLCKKKVLEAYLENVRQLWVKYRDSATRINMKVQPASDMASKIVSDLMLNISTDGIVVASDDSGVEAAIVLPSHKNAPPDVLERICARYDAVIKGLKQDVGTIVDIDAVADVGTNSTGE